MNIEVRRRQRPVVVPEANRAPDPAHPDLAEAACALALKVVYLPSDQIRPSSRNAHTHSKKQIHKIASSLKRYGFVNPILIGDDGEVIAGHGRIEAARQLGLKQVPTICLSHMSEAEKRAYRIADNRLAELAGWDDDLLKIEFEELAILDLDLLDDTGFETAEIDFFFEGPATLKKEKADPADALPEIAEGVAVSRPGDLWLLGDHRLVCGNALEAATYALLLDAERVSMVFTDPPYNVRVDGHVGGLGKVKHREFAMASGEMSRGEFVAFLTAVFERMAAVSVDGAIHFTCIDWAHLREMLEAGHAVFDELKNIVCWAKTNGGMGSFYRSQHELIPVWKKGKAPHINNIELGAHGRYRTNVWTYAGANTFRRGRMEDLASHPTVKPCALVMDAIKDCSKPGDVVLDPFGGSGTTLIAAEKTRRHARLIELDGGYLDLTIRRWEKLTGREAVHAVTGKTFAETATERAVSAGSTPEAEETSDGE
jgi:DNA modification methylase